MIVVATNLEPLTPRNAAIYLALFIVITWGFTLLPTGFLERITTETCSNTLSFLGYASNWGIYEGKAYLTLIGELKPVTVTIIRECTAINVFAVIVGLVLPLKNGSLARKMYSIVFSGCLLFILNVSRIILTVYLTVYNVSPFSWFFTNPTVEVYHYPISFIYGVIGVAMLILILNKWMLPELGNTFMGFSESLRKLVINT